MGRYFKETDISADNKPKLNEKIQSPSAKIYNVSQDDIRSVKKRNRYKKSKAKGIDYNKRGKDSFKRHKKKDASDPFPGRKKVDQKKLYEHSRGHMVDVKSVKSKIKKKEIQQQEKNLKFATEQAARVEVLLPEEAGYLEGDEDQEFTAQLTQTEIKKAVDEESAAKSFDLKLPQFGPYYIDYTRNGKYLLIGGRKGHVAAFDWTSKSLMCEINAMESVHNVSWLHTENLFAVAQKKWTHVYDNQGIEIHCVKTMNNIIQLEYLPYHFLLAGSSESGNITWLDVSLGKIVKDTYTKMGRLDVMCQNPSSAVLVCGHSNGTVTMWTPNLKDPAAKMLAHGQAVRGVTVDRSGTYLATASVDRSLKIWDVRAFKCVHEYKLARGAAQIRFSQRNLLGVGAGNLVQVYKDPTKGEISHPYMKHEVAGAVGQLQFCPYEDVLGIGHGGGFSSILVPGSGEPNFDALEANPYQNVKQRKEAEVKMLLDKISPELITIDSDALTGVDAPTLQEKLEERNKKLFLKPTNITFDPRHKMKGKGGSAKRHHIRKKVIEEARMSSIKSKIVSKSVRREGEEKKPPKVYKNVLDRFK